jgi:hypothetical protein
MCRSEPAPTQTRFLPNSVRSISTCWTARGSGNGATPPGSKPVASSTSFALATLALPQPIAAATLPASARRSPGTITTTGSPSHRKTSDLTISDGSQPTARAASSAVGVPSGNSSTVASALASRRKAATRSTAGGHSVTREL